MKNLLIRLYHDDCGGIVTTEWIWLCSILVLGAIAGLVGIKNAINAQLGEVSSAILSADPLEEVRPLAPHQNAGNGHLSVDVRVGPMEKTPRGVEVDGMPCD